MIEYDASRRAVGLALYNSVGRATQVFYKGHLWYTAKYPWRHMCIHIGPHEQLIDIITDRAGRRFGVRVLVRRCELFNREYNPR